MSASYRNAKASVAASACFLATGLVAAAVLTPSTAIAQAKKQEVTVTVERVTAVDKIDALSRPDFFARVTIDGKVATSPFEKDKTDISPNWMIANSVTPGRILIKVEILDKDVQQNDSVDINRLPSKRDLDFTLDTRSCRIDGFANNYKCGSKIVRAGDERRAAEITFSVSVK